jgi:hypothetical protein
MSDYTYCLLGRNRPVIEAEVNTWVAHFRIITITAITQKMFPLLPNAALAQVCTPSGCGIKRACLGSVFRIWFGFYRTCEVLGEALIPEMLENAAGKFDNCGIHSPRNGRIIPTGGGGVIGGVIAGVTNDFRTVLFLEVFILFGITVIDRSCDGTL